ncbi:hypothetical protein CR513_17620, partial [Mucuna pruriens]
MNNVKLSRLELSQSNSVASVCTQSKSGLISLCQDHIGSVPTESNSASGRDESILYTLDSASFYFTLIHIRAYCVLERNRPRVDYAIMDNNDRTLKELATPDVVYQPWCIQYPQLELAQTYELKSNLIHLLPKFQGLAGEDPHKHLKEFHMVCSTMRPQGILEDYIKMKALPFFLNGAAKDWSYLQPALLNT